MGQNDDILSDSSSAATPESSSEPISSESLSSRAEIPSSTFFEPSQRRSRAKRTLISLE
jgi:hypothetical protein